MLKRLLFASLAYALAAPPARASFLSGEMLDTAADILAIVVLFLVPIVGIVVFWIVHVLPEKIAEKRHHPQTAAITTLCLLSLVFGGLLWPIAWLWAFTKPVVHRMAYGTDKHEDFFEEMAEKHREGKLLREEAFHLREELEAMEARGALPPNLRTLKDELARLRASEAQTRAPAPASNTAKDRAA
jgi:CBS domain containing-hemolysin-like protein